MRRKRNKISIALIALILSLPPSVDSTYRLLTEFNVRVRKLNVPTFSKSPRKKRAAGGKITSSIIEKVKGVIK